ncbi:MAG: hypothetical protein AAGF56_01785 [Pseudomonadota bacterium]
MTIDFALSLSFEGIELLQRVARGWRVIGRVDVESETLAEDLSGLREKGIGLATGQFHTKLIIPADQIKFTAIDSTQTTDADVTAVLDGATPYAVDDLVVDCDRSGGRTHIAAVAKDTLAEAEAFAGGHGFNPVAFVAVPEPFTFQREVFFGPTRQMPTILGDAVTVGPDSLPVMRVGTRVKSRLLLFDEHADQTADRLADELAEKLPMSADKNDGVQKAPVEKQLTLEEAERARAPEPVAVPAPPAQPIWIDRIIPQVIPAPVPITVATPRPVIIPETPKLAQLAYFDDIIPEVQETATAVLAPAKAHVLVAPKKDGKPRARQTLTAVPAQAAAKPANKNALLPAFAAVAALALIGVVGWSEFSRPAASDVTLTSSLSVENLGLAPSAGQEGVALSAARDDGIVAATPTLPAKPTAEVAVITSQPVIRPEPGPAVAILELVELAALEIGNLNGLTLPSFAAPVATQTPKPVAIPTADSAEILIDPPAAPPPPPVIASADPPAPLGQVLTPDQAAAAYASTGVWQRAPRIFDMPSPVILLQFLPPEIVTNVARPTPPQAFNQAEVLPDQPFSAPNNPPPPDARFERDESGFILATPEGTVTPNGTIVFAGLPEIAITPRPEISTDDLNRMALLAPAPPGVVIVPGPPPLIPPLRPENAALPDPNTDLETETEPLPPGSVGITGLELQNSGAVGLDPATVEAGAETDPRPQLRPQGLQPDTQDATPDITAIIAGIEAEDATLRFDNSTSLAVALSLRPDARPANFGSVVASARAVIEQQQAAAAAPAPIAAAAPVPPQNFDPVPGGVARAATQEDAIRLRDLNLIGVYGRPNARRALVRLPNGRFVRVEVGSALDGGQVTAIGDTALNYVKRGRTYAIQLPEG